MKVGVVLVTYNPNIDLVSRFVKHIDKYVDHIIVVDNSKINYDLENLLSGKKNTIILNRSNRGIAEAQNQGIKYAIEIGMDNVFIFDQDTKINDAFVSKMIHAFNSMNFKERIACVGPNYEDMNNNTIDAIEKDFIIASGSLYNVSIFDKVGYFKSEWFIDLIDVEWCHRAKKHGYISYQIQNIKMEHNIDDNDYPTLFGKQVRIGSPVRQYYLIRNWILSLKSNSFSLKFKIKTMYYLCHKPIIFLLCSPRKTRFKYIIRGFKDGLCNITGEFKERE